MKRWLLILVLSLLAQGSCKEETYYSYSEYKEFEHLLDSNYSTDDTVIINSNNIVMHINGLGTFSSPKMVDPYDLSGQTSVISVNDNVKDPIHFSLSFSEEIYIDEFNFIINAFHDKHSLNKKVYLNHSIEWVGDTVNFYGGELIYEGNDTSRIELKPYKKARNIMVVFDGLSEGDIVELNSFIVEKYRVRKHAYWTKDYIAGGETYKITSCIDSGKFNPNGNIYYEYDSYTKFNPSASLISDYKPVLKKALAAYDYGRGGNISQYGSLNIIKNVDEYSRGIVGFKTAGLPNSISSSFYSYGKYGEEFPWIETANQGGVQYIAYPVHWSQYPSISSVVHISRDSNWCKHTTNSYTTPCYKYSGHVSNTRLNSYDVVINMYDKVIPPSLQKVDSADYYLYNELTKDKQYIKSSSIMDEEFHINKSGQYRVIANLNDSFGNSNEVNSDIFYIDQDGPSIKYSPNSSGWTNKIIDVNIDVKDELSGVKTYDVQLNREEYYHNKDSIKLDKEGTYYLKTVASDFVLNQSVEESGLYNLDFTKPIIDYVANVEYENLMLDLNIYDELSKLDYWQHSLSYDDGLNYDYPSDKYFDEILSLNFNLAVPLTIKIEAYDKAGNHQELILKYEKQDSKIEALKLFSYRYQLNEENLLYISVNKKEQLKFLEIYQNNQLISKQELEKDKTDIDLEIPYISDVDSTILKVIVYNSKYELEETLELSIDKISEEKLNEEGSITYNDIVASSVSMNQDQLDYYEKLMINEIKEESNYFQGQGIQVMAKVEYQNECHSYTNNSCNSSDELVYYDNYLSIDNGATPIKDEYLNNDNYLVKMHNINNTLMLDEVFVTRHEGLVYSSTPNVPYINGGRKWYLDKNIDLGEHSFNINGFEYGYNQVDFSLLSKYLIDKKISDQYKIRFINPFEYNHEQLDDFLNRIK